MVCSSCFAASSVFGGKNSKEKVGRLRASSSLMCILVYWYQRRCTAASGRNRQTRGRLLDQLANPDISKVDGLVVILQQERHLFGMRFVRRPSLVIGRAGQRDVILHQHAVH